MKKNGISVRVKGVRNISSSDLKNVAGGAGRPVNIDTSRLRTSFNLGNVRIDTARLGQALERFGGGTGPCECGLISEFTTRK